MNRFVVGAIAGLIATVPMTLLMVAWHRRLPQDQQYPLPPHEITMNAAEDADVEETVEDPVSQTAATLAAHFGYGAAAGAAYAALAPSVPLPPLVKGGLFGLTVWSVSYLGLMPAIGWHRSATEEPAGRNTLMLTANMLWGAVTAVLTDLALPVSGNCLPGKEATIKGI
jgi:putative membrane protein